MLNRIKGTIVRVISERQGAQEVLVSIDCEEARAVNYPDLTGDVAPGDEVLLNTMAVDLDLGTGGMHFVICNLSMPVQEVEPSPGHIMKLRYTPLQVSVLSVEEDDSPDRERIRQFQSLDGMPVICCELHSQIAPAAAALKALTDYRARVAYVMTDGAALPISFSRLASELKEKRLIDVTVTCGQAFGGDVEAINVYTALIAARQVADAVIVSQGPGNAGAGSKYGFSGIQQGEALNAGNILGGTSIAAVRLSFADARERHRGVSHHTITILGDIAIAPVLVALPELPEEKARFVEKQLAPLVEKAVHRVCIVDGEPGLVELAEQDVRVTTMGRSIQEDREFFLAASAAGALASTAVDRKSS